MAAVADIQILNLRLPLLVEITKVAVSWDVKAAIQEATLEEDNFVRFCDRLIDQIVLSFYVEAICTEPSSRIDDAASLPKFGAFTGIHISRELLGDCTIRIFGRSSREGSPV